MGEILYDVLIYPYQFTSKEHAQKSVGIIKNNILRYPRSMAIKEIANACISGKVIAFCHAEKTGINKSFTKECWQYQQLYAFDFDNGFASTVEEKKTKKKFEAPYYMTWQAALVHAQKQGFSPAFIYTSSSHTEDWHRFRMVFALDTKISSFMQHEQVEKAFMQLFSISGRTILDKSCSDPSRIFYPGKELVYQNSRAITSLKKLLEKYHDNRQSILCVGESTSYDKQRERKASKGYSADIKRIVEEVKIYQERRQNAAKSLRSRMALGVRGNLKSYNEIYNSFVISLPDLQKSVTPRAISVPEDFDAFCYQINLAKLLNLSENKNFPCILPHHEDQKASANINWHEGKYKYRCYGCNATYDIYGLLEKLTGCSRSAIKDWVCAKFNVRYETNWQRYHKEEILFYHDYMITSLKQDYPYLHKTLVQNGESGILNMFLDLGRIYLMDRQWSGINKPVFVYSLSKFCEKAKYFGINKSRRGMYNSIIHLARLGLIEILNDEKMPKKLLDFLESYKQAHKQHRRINCYAIPTLTQDLLQDAERVLRNDKKFSVRKIYLCYEQIARSSGAEKADAVYVQARNQKDNRSNLDTFYNRYKAACERILKKKDWTTEEEIINRLKGFNKVQ